jgi:hypothetical protein
MSNAVPNRPLFARFQSTTNRPTRTLTGIAIITRAADGQSAQFSCRIAAIDETCLQRRRLRWPVLRPS